MYNDTPGLPPSKIAPTVGQNCTSNPPLPPPPVWRSSHNTKVGKITLPSTILQFWDLGGQRDIRTIWEKYYDECHAVAYVVDAADQARLDEGWAVFGT
jgi:ADP-ribosylation factor related protein 1